MQKRLITRFVLLWSECEIELNLAETCASKVTFILMITVLVAVCDGSNNTRPQQCSSGMLLCSTHTYSVVSVGGGIKYMERSKVFGLPFFFNPPPPPPLPEFLNHSATYVVHTDSLTSSDDSLSIVEEHAH